MKIHPSWNFESGDSGFLSPGKTLAIRCITWAAFLYAITYGLMVASVFGSQWLSLPPYADYAAAIALPIVGFALYGLLVIVGERRSPTEIAFRASSLFDLAIGAIIGFTILVVMLLLLYFMGFYRIHTGHWSGWFNSFVFDSYISGMLEEIAFRAVLLRIFARLFNSPIAGLLISSALFGVAHLTHATWFQAFEIAFNAGLTLGLPYMITGRLWMSVGLHIGWDFTEESLLGINTQHGILQSVPDLTKSVFLTGGAYGPDGSIIASAVTIVAIVAMLRAKKSGWLRKS